MHTVSNRSPYYFQKNLQGDVIRICNVNGDTVVQYTYDAWGEVLNVTGSLANTIGKINPFRYRGYYSDIETGFYYLQSRYYDPVVGRFLNADEVLFAVLACSSASFNLFNYCNNNVINLCDPFGCYCSSLAINYPLLSDALAGIMAGLGASITSIKAAIATSWFVPICIAAAAIAVIGIVYVINRVISLYQSAERAIAAVKAKVKANGIDPNKLYNNTVYVITRKGTIDVVYVGITSNYPARHARHTGKGGRYPTALYTMMPIATGLTRIQARVMEQTIISAYTLIALDNMINSISISKWWRFKESFEQILSLMESWIDPE